MPSKTKKANGPKKTKNSTKLDDFYQCSLRTDKDDELELEIYDYSENNPIPKAIRLNNAVEECKREDLNALSDPFYTKKPRRKIAGEHGVLESTIRSRLKGAIPWAQKSAEQQRLSVIKENAVIQWVYQLEAWGFPPRVERLRRLVEDILVQNGVNITIPGERLGNAWQYYFFKRHPEIKTKFLPPLDKERALAQDSGVFQRYFELFSTIKDKFNVELSDIYNMDEKGFIRGVIDKARVIVSRNEWFKGKPFVIQDGGRDWTTVIECVSLTGKLLPPWVIFKGVQCRVEWLKKLLKYNSKGKIAMTGNGWTDNEIGARWFKELFIPSTSGDNLKGEYRLMLYDGHASHISSEVIRECIRHKVILLCLPAHTTHLLQPLDIGLFGPLATYYKQEIRTKSTYGYNLKVDQLDFLNAYFNAREKALSIGNITSAFRKAGLEPYDPTFIIDQLPETSRKSTIETVIKPVTSRPSTAEGAPSNFELKTPGNGRNIRDIITKVRDGKITAEQALDKISKATERAFAEVATLGELNHELHAASQYRKERENRNHDILKPAEARVYDQSSLDQRALWYHEVLEKETLAEHRRLGPVIFSFQPKPPRKKKQWVKATGELIILPIRATTSLTLEEVFKSPSKSPQKGTSTSNLPLKTTSRSKATKTTNLPSKTPKTTKPPTIPKITTIPKLTTGIKKRKGKESSIRRRHKIKEAIGRVIDEPDALKQTTISRRGRIIVLSAKLTGL